MSRTLYNTVEEINYEISRIISKINSYKRAFAVKCLKNKINLITFFKEGSFIDYVRNDEFDIDEVDVANHIASQTCLPLIYVVV